MADNKPTNRERVKEIVAGIEGGIKDLFQSERYVEYLRTMSRFHSYSYRNTILIHMQRPDATLVAGFNKWKNQFQRHVKKGEKGMTILAPTPFKKKIEQQKMDPDTLAPIRDLDGNIVTEEKIMEIPMFRPVKVFDVKQTEGKPIPSLAMDLTGNVQHYEAFMEALRRTSPVPVEIKPIKEAMDGYFSLTKQIIVIRDDISEVQTVCTAVHEIAHATLHNRQKEQNAAAAGAEESKPAKPKDEKTREVEAESVSYAVCQYFGIETSANSLGYIASWSSGKELPELKASLETISKTADFLITSIDRHFNEICKERGIVLEQAEAEQDVLSLEEPANTAPEADYIFTMERNPYPVRENDQYLIRAREASDQTLNPEQVLFIGSETVCGDLLGLLQNGELRPDDFFHTTAASVSRYITKNGAELDVFTAMDDKVYLGLRELYDNRGHYLNHDKSLLQVSDNYQMFAFLSGSGYTETQSEMLKEGFFTSEDYAEFAAMQADVLTQFEEREPLLFAGKPFSFPPLDTVEATQEIPSIPEAPEQKEALFLVDNAAYLHIQTSDAGYDYTLYDKAALRQLDGGQIDPLDVFSQGGLRPVADAILISIPDLKGDTVESVPLEMLETLRDMKDTILDTYPMPDPLFSKVELDKDYGYQGDDMLPLSRDSAAELMERDFTIYAIVDGGYAEMVFDGDDLDRHPPDTMFTVPCEEWEASPDFQQAIADRMNHQEEREKAFLDHAGDCFAIYQMPLNEETRFIRFEPLDRLHENGFDVERERYDLVYTSPISDAPNVLTALNRLWEKFNIDHPADYRCPSMSISDIIALKLDGVVSCHYCDRYGFSELQGFIQPENYLRNAELSAEDDYNMIDGIINNGPKEPTVAELEAQVKAGQQISLTDLAGAVHRERKEKRKSVVAQLKEKTPQDRQKTAQKKNLEKGR